MTKLIHQLKDTELYNEVRKVTGLHGASLNDIFLESLYAYDMNIIRVSETLAKQESWAASFGAETVQTTTEHQQHDPMYQIWEENVVYGSTPMEALFRCIVKRFNKEYR